MASARHLGAPAYTRYASRRKLGKITISGLGPGQFEVSVRRTGSGLEYLKGKVGVDGRNEVHLQWNLR
jgi:hypothetical protein